MTEQKNVNDDELAVDGEEEDGETFVAYDIASYPSDLTLSGIKDLWDAGDILIPNFQRNYVWKIKQASLLIESFLLGLPVPQIFLYVDDENKSLIIDGQQRILSTIYFFEGYFGGESSHGRRQIFRLTGLDERSPFANKKFDELEPAMQRRLKSSVLRAINIRQLTPKNEHTSVYHIFERLNTGGTPLKPQEIRNCVFRGSLGQYLRNLNEDKNWRLIIGKKVPDTHQKDVELLLRVFALAGKGVQSYEKPMKEFLNLAMARDQDGKSKRAANFFRGFPKATEAIVAALGERPFHIRGPLNSSVLDSVFCAVLKNGSALPPDFKKRFSSLMKREDFLQNTYYGTSDVNILQARFKEAEQILFG